MHLSLKLHINYYIKCRGHLYLQGCRFAGRAVSDFIGGKQSEVTIIPSDRLS